MLPLAPVDELAKLILGGISLGDETTLAGALLSGASSIIRAHTSKTFLTSDGLALENVPDAVVTVTMQCAKRAFLNPDGTIAETVAGYSSRVSEKATEGLYLTTNEKATLTAAVSTGSSGGLWVQPTTRGTSGEPMFNVPVSTGGAIFVQPPGEM